MDSAETVIGEIVENLIEGDDKFLVGVHVSGHPGSRKVTIHLDSDDGLNIDTCSHVSKRLVEILDEQDVLDGAYTLEVSSPGLDQPLFLPRQYKKNLGRMVKVVTVDKVIHLGRLEHISDNNIEIEVQKGKGKKKTSETITLELSEISKTTVVVVV